MPFADGEIPIETVFDGEHDRYLLLPAGRDKDRRVPGCLVPVDISGEEFWIQRHGTAAGIGTDQVAAGVPKEHLVLAFRSLEPRKLSGFAVA